MIQFLIGAAISIIISEFSKKRISRNCIELISKNENILANGYYHEFDNFVLVAYNSGGQKDLSVFNTVNLLLAKELSKLLNLNE